MIYHLFCIRILAIGCGFGYLLLVLLDGTQPGRSPLASSPLRSHLSRRPNPTLSLSTNTTYRSLRPTSLHISVALIRLSSAPPRPCSALAQAQKRACMSRLASLLHYFITSRFPTAVLHACMVSWIYTASVSLTSFLAFLHGRGHGRMELNWFLPFPSLPNERKSGTKDGEEMGIEDCTIRKRRARYDTLRYKARKPFQNFKNEGREETINR